MRTFLFVWCFGAFLFPVSFSFAQHNPDDFKILLLGGRDTQTGTLFSDELHFTRTFTLNNPANDIEIIELHDGINRVSKYARAGNMGKCSVLIGDYFGIEKALRKLKTNSDELPVIDTFPQYSIVDVRIFGDGQYAGTRIYMIKRFTTKGPGKLILDCPGLFDAKVTIADLKKEADHMFTIHRLAVNKVVDRDSDYRN